MNIESILAWMREDPKRFESFFAAAPLPFRPWECSELPNGGMLEEWVRPSVIRIPGQTLPIASAIRYDPSLKSLTTDKTMVWTTRLMLSTGSTRYEYFRTLEEAKDYIDKTLIDYGALLLDYNAVHTSKSNLLFGETP